MNSCVRVKNYNHSYIYNIGITFQTSTIIIDSLDRYVNQIDKIKRGLNRELNKYLYFNL